MRAPEQCLILIGGLETRSGQHAMDLRDPLLPVGPRPFLDYLLMEAARFGFKRILLLTGNAGEKPIEYVAQSGIADRLHIQIDVLAVEPPAGTGGALWRARDRLDDHFYLLDGHSWFDCNWLSLVTADGADRAIATVASPRQPERSSEGQINAGLSLISREIAARLQPNCSLERDIFPRLAEAGLLRANMVSGRFFDMRMPGNLERAQNLVSNWQKRPAFFLDRDGTLNDDKGYVHRIADFDWLPGAIESIKLINDAGCYAFIVTNQAGVARGMYAEADIRALHAWMQDELRNHGAHIDDIRYCPHHRDGTIEAYRKAHPWRKPEPGMVLDLMAHWPVDAAQSIMIGDKDLDAETGRAAGIRGVRIGAHGLLPEVQSAIKRLEDNRSDCV